MKKMHIYVQGYQNAGWCVGTGCHIYYH